MVVAAIAFVHTDLDAGELLDADEDGSQGVAVVGIATARLGARGCDRDLAAELVGRPSLALSNAPPTSGAWSVQGIELPAALALCRRTRSARDRRAAKASLSAGSSPILRSMLRISRPTRVRRNRTMRSLRLNCLAWA